MTVATQTEPRVPRPESRVPSAESRRSSRRMIALWQHRALRAEWAKFSPELLWECSEDEARHRWSSEILHRPVTTWATLTYGEANRLLHALKEASGSNASYRAQMIARLAVELFGSDWDAILRERLQERFGSRKLEVGNREGPHFPLPTSHSRLYSLSPAEAHAEIEELISRIARRDGVEIEEVRKRVKSKG